MMQGQIADLHKEVMDLKKSKDAIILAHNYQIPEVQGVADYVGDSLGLARKAASTLNERIVFCGVHFMAETASILCPDKKVLIPDTEAGCSLSDSITVKDLLEWKKRHPKAIAVGYVNTTAQIKAELDYCCTSSNAVKVVQSIPKDKEILFLPDMFLGAYVAKMTGRKNIRIWAGECHVHAGITAQDVQEKLDFVPEAEFLIHPECSCTSSILYDVADGRYDKRQVGVYSTEGMMKRVANSDAKKFIVATETGILHQMREQNQGKTFIAASDKAECQYMKMINLQKVYDSLVHDRYVVSVPEIIATRARKAIDRMLDIC
ncbi:MAG: quinolinate synthetase A [Cenarchaeum symbiont of Oopsacas minuta]|nr:quinolinate synthetase A [Cenarchaeum symbiont of Oopsacas minuta]